MTDYYDPEEYIVTTITVAMPVGPNTYGGPHIVTIDHCSNSTASESVTLNLTSDEVAALDAAWIQLWEAAAVTGNN